MKQFHQISIETALFYKSIKYTMYKLRCLFFNLAVGEIGIQVNLRKNQNHGSTEKS